MHTRKRHSELYHELNQKFHTFDRYRSQSSAKVRALLLLPLPTPPSAWSLRGGPLSLGVMIRVCLWVEWYIYF